MLRAPKLKKYNNNNNKPKRVTRHISSNSYKKSLQKITYSQDISKTKKSFTQKQNLKFSVFSKNTTFLYSYSQCHSPFLHRFFSTRQMNINNAKKYLSPFLQKTNIFQKKLNINNTKRNFTFGKDRKDFELFGEIDADREDFLEYVKKNGPEKPSIQDFVDLRKKYDEENSKRSDPEIREELREVLREKAKQWDISKGFRQETIDLFIEDLLSRYSTFQTPKQIEFQVPDPESEEAFSYTGDLRPSDLAELRYDQKKHYPKKFITDVTDLEEAAEVYGEDYDIEIDTPEKAEENPDGNLNITYLNSLLMGEGDYRDRVEMYQQAYGINKAQKMSQIPLPNLTTKERIYKGDPDFIIKSLILAQSENPLSESEINDLLDKFLITFPDDGNLPKIREKYRKWLNFFQKEDDFIDPEERRRMAYRFGLLAPDQKGIGAKFSFDDPNLKKVLNDEEEKELVEDLVNNAEKYKYKRDISNPPPENYKPKLYETHSMVEDGPKLLAMFFARMHRKYTEEKKNPPSEFQKCYQEYLHFIFEENSEEIAQMFEDNEEAEELYKRQEELKQFQLSHHWKELILDDQPEPFKQPQIAKAHEMFKKELGITKSMELKILKERSKSIDEHASEYNETMVKAEQDEDGFLDNTGFSEKDFSDGRGSIFDNPKLELARQQNEALQEEFKNEHFESPEDKIEGTGEQIENAILEEDKDMESNAIDEWEQRNEIAPIGTHPFLNLPHVYKGPNYIMPNLPSKETPLLLEHMRYVHLYPKIVREWILWGKLPPGYYDLKGNWVKMAQVDAMLKPLGDEEKTPTDWDKMSELEFENWLEFDIDEDLKGQWRFGLTSENVEHLPRKLKVLFSMKSASTREIKSYRYRVAIQKFGNNQYDTGNPAVLVAILSERVFAKTYHIQSNPRDKNAKRSLEELLHKRTTAMRYLKKKNPGAYYKVLREMGVADTVPPIGIEKARPDNPTLEVTMDTKVYVPRKKNWKEKHYGIVSTKQVLEPDTYHKYGTGRKKLGRRDQEKRNNLVHLY